ncbi:uncharacterized protein LOC106161284 isoform X2 [Lingula anatina]|uniref:Uncharacterized protein LOC106161284 isoform X2 n=1 Tax=Lingula anatina TaxID=7574 RepID=A0A1S3I609_LINAN|nr:uncharacterized protein LOC106161284 isoform X2 [Lingula anatina]|eukprot:XP_013393643.1 uncharacterized protein LOC106161284 isoform X2 [Lingula anatina]
MAVTVRSFSDAIELIRRHEEETAFHYVKDKRDKKRFESEISLHGDEKIFWNIAAKNGDFSIKYDGIPFVFLGKKTFLCQNGRDKGIFMKKRWKEKKEKLMKEDHVFIKNRFLQQPTKKMGCKARIEIKKIAKFPDFKVSTNSRGAKEGALKMLKKALQMKSSLAVDVQYLIYIPSKEEHQYHLTGEMGGYSEPVDPMVRSKVLELLENGLRSRRELEACVREYVVNQMFQGKEPPPKSRRRYFPHAVDFANLITKYKLQKRFSKIDQVNVEKMLQEVPSEYLCFFRGCSSTVEDIPSSVKEDTLDDDPVVDMEELSDVRECKMPGNKLLFVYQTPEMQRLYRIYGQTLLLDATYRTCRYALPLFFLVVRTNVDYQVVAFFVVQQETRESIAEALTIIRNRTPEVIPEYGMVDFASEEILALEDVYLGIQVYLCDFHREQAWVRWLNKGSNGVAANPDNVEGVKKHLRKMATACTEEELKSAVNALHSSKVYQSNSKLQHWLSKIWMPEIKRWSHAYRPPKLILAVNTNNGVERMNEDLKHGYLDKRRQCSLSELLHVLMNQFLPAKYQRMSRCF